MVNLFKLLFVFTLLTFSFAKNTQASHISGGDISYECVGQDSFLVTLKLFRDCAGISAPTTGIMTFTSTCGGSVNATLTQNSFAEISQLCPTQLSNSTCSSGALPGLQEYIYSGLVVLSPACNTWTMAWSSCCRNNAVTNVSPNGTYLYSTLYSGVDSCNSSPYFTSAPAPFVCLNQPVNYNFGVIEPDGDSIVYFLSPGFENATTLVTYLGTYSYTQPIAGANMVLNSFNGQLTFTPTVIGIYVVVVRVEEYDRVTGVIKGTTIRDIQVVVQNCSNNSPTISTGGIYNYSGAGSRIDSSNVEVCVGDSFSFDLSVSDADTSNIVSISNNLGQVFNNNFTVSLTSGNPAVLHVSGIAPSGFPVNNQFTITGSDNSCPVLGKVYGAFNIKINKSTYAGEDDSICAGAQWVDLNVEGGTAFTWVAISGSPIDTVSTSPNFNMTCTTCNNPSVSPQVTTTYVVYSNLSGGCSNIDTVVVNVSPDFTLAMSNDTGICTIDSLQLFVNATPATNSYTYQWSPNLSITNDSISNPISFLTETTTYHVTVSALNGCVKTDEVTVSVSSSFPQNITVTGDSVICQGESIQLEVNLGNVPSANCGISANNCSSVPATGTIGTGISTNTNQSYPAPYSNYYWGAKHQILYTAAELHAMGMPNGGMINSIAFDIVTLGNVNFNNFEIKMGCTSSSDLSGGWESGLVTVLPGYTHVPIIGWNQHTFLNPYNWDGVSNLVIEICQNNSSYAAAGSSLSTYTPTSFQSVLYYRADIGTVCSSTAAGTVSVDRPNTQFNYCSATNSNNFTYSWGPNTNIDSVNIATPTVNPTSTTTYSVVVQDSAGTCADTIDHLVTVVTEYDAGFTNNSPYCLNDPVDTLMPLVSGGLFTGSGVTTTGGFNPILAGIGTWAINYDIATPVACANDSTILITVLPLPDASITYQEFCIGSSPETLSVVTPGGIWSGVGINDSTSGVFDPTGLIAGSYTVTYSLSYPCNNSSTQQIKIVEPYSFTFTNPLMNVCEGGSLDLSSEFTLSSNPLQGSGPVISTWSNANGLISANGLFDASGISPGSYVVYLTVAGADGFCGTTQSMIVQVDAIQYPSTIGNLTYCVSETSAKILVTPWLFGNGASYTQTPLGSLTQNDTLNILPFGQNGMFDATIQGEGQWEFEISYTNNNGCTGVYVDTIHVLAIADTSVTNLGNELIAVATGGYTYQWLDCDNGMSPISGATSQNFIPGAKGHYAVEISNGSCIETSDCYETWPLGVGNSVSNYGLSIYPNPTDDELHIDMGQNVNVNIVITDNTGKEIFNGVAKNQVTTIDMSKLASGVYFVKLNTENGVFTEKIIKQ
jgi:hypothetical protein